MPPTLGFYLHVRQQTQALVNLRPRMTAGQTHGPGAQQSLENLFLAVWPFAAWFIALMTQYVQVLIIAHAFQWA